MTPSRQVNEKLQKLVGQLLTALPDNELQKLQTQLDELEARTTAEEANRLEKLLHSVVSVANLQKAVKKV